jgi:hypothetical protein
MPLYLITPTKLDVEDWRASSYHGPIQVEAANSEEARYAASRFFRLEAPLRPGDAVIIYMPWLNRIFVQRDLLMRFRQTFLSLGPQQVGRPYGGKG